MDKTLYILRGVSGSGKTTLAKTLETSLGYSSTAISADDYWYERGDGKYDFDPTLLGEAHKYCRKRVRLCMLYSMNNIILHNTTTTEREIEPYLELAEEYDYKVVSLIVENRHGNGSVHNVPKGVVEGQEKRLRNNLKLK